VSRKWKNWYQKDVDEEVKGVDSRDKMKHNEGAISYCIFLERMMSVAERVTTGEERVLRGR